MYSRTRIPGPFRVYVGLVSTGYLAKEAIDRVVQNGIEYCGLQDKLKRLSSSSKLIVKPDLTMSESRIARHACAHVEVTRSTISHVLSHAPRGAVTVLGATLRDFPATRVFKRAGYYELENEFPGQVELLAEDEAPLARYQLSKGNMRSPREQGPQYRVTNEICAPQDYYDSDFTVYIPKLKTSATSHGFSGAIRLGDATYRGALSDAHLCDALEVCNPDLIVSDGIIASIGGNEITQRGHELGTVLVANNALAHDWVAALILNLDPMSIPHLKTAAERGWGPERFSQIEIGGAGLEAIGQLAQKTKFWDLGFLSLREFGQKFSRENPGLEFPIEIISNPATDSVGVDGLFLDWLYLTYDFPARRSKIAHWPKCSVLIGDIAHFPHRTAVYVLGDTAIRSLDKITSESRLFFKFDRYEIRVAKLKNGKKHVLIRVKGSPPRLRNLIFAFALGSLGRMRTRIITPTLLFDRFVFKVRQWWKSPLDENLSPIVMTTRMRTNSWWSLRPTQNSVTRAPDAQA